jgi:hypothetical protein
VTNARFRGIADKVCSILDHLLGLDEINLFFQRL